MVTTSLKVFKARGIRGSWLADVRGLGRLACIHKEWLKAGHYKEQRLSGEGSSPHSKKRQELNKAIRDTGMDVLTKDDIVKGASADWVFGRAAYLSIWRIDNFVVHEDGLIELDLIQPCVGVCR